MKVSRHTLASYAQSMAGASDLAKWKFEYEILTAFPTGAAFLFATDAQLALVKNQTESSMKLAKHIREVFLPRLEEDNPVFTANQLTLAARYMKNHGHVAADIRMINAWTKKQ